MKLEHDEQQMILKSINDSKSGSNDKRRFLKFLLSPRATLELELRIVQFLLSKHKRLQQPLNRHIIKLQTILQKFHHDSTQSTFSSKKLTAEHLLVELKKKNLRSSDLTKQFIKNNCDPSVSLWIITLKDPITTLRMKLPAKGKKCEHLQCFDAMYFLQMNEKKQTWSCPICRKQVKFEDIEIDEFFLTILQSSKLSEECENIILYNDGTWAPSETKLYRDNLITNNCPFSNKKEITSIDSYEDKIHNNFDNEKIEPTASLMGSNLLNNTNLPNINECEASTSVRSKGNENQQKFKPRPVICVITLD